ncbi:MAG: hypothetical protein WBQ82_10700, partial [Methyloceanibacter sp.]
DWSSDHAAPGTAKRSSEQRAMKGNSGRITAPPSAPSESQDLCKPATKLANEALTSIGWRKGHFYFTREILTLVFYPDKKSSSERRDQDG